MGTEGALQMISEYAVVTNVDAVALSFSGQPLVSSDALSREVEAWQFVCGEGPTVEAHAHNAPIGTSDMAMWKQRWMWLADAVGSWPFRASFAFPVTIGSVSLGALTFYRVVPGPMTSSDRAAAVICADHAAHWLADVLVDGGPCDFGDFDRLHRAAGVVIAQSGMDTSDALATIRAHSFGTQRHLADVLDDVLAMRLMLTSPHEEEQSTWFDQ